MLFIVPCQLSLLPITHITPYSVRNRIIGTKKHFIKSTEEYLNLNIIGEKKNRQQACVTKVKGG